LVRNFIAAPTPPISTRVVIDRCEARNHFFLKKEAKTFCRLAHAAPQRQEFIKQKFFGSFFQKKNDLLSMASRYSARLNHVSNLNPVGITHLPNSKKVGIKATLLYRHSHADGSAYAPAHRMRALLLRESLPGCWARRGRIVR